ncbi:MAG TPA: GIY-YIG nuclease family protein [Balneolales bacterium]|nr:GIY-YIG nuclease family protein [Balneolales bacterium]
MKTKKELKEEYKQMKFPMGVFQVRNTINGKIFVDSSTNMSAKWNRNRLQLSVGNHPNKELQNDWNKFGEEAFKFEVIEELEHNDKEIVDYNNEVALLEEMLIEELQPFGVKGYNKVAKKG